MATEADDSDSGFRSVTPTEDRKPSEDREEYKRMFSFLNESPHILNHKPNMSSAGGNKETEYSWWHSYHQCLWCLECSRRFLLETERLSENDRYNREINSKNPNTKNKRGILAFISQMSSPQ